MDILEILEVHVSDRGIKRRDFLGKTALGLFTAGFGLPKLKAGSHGQERPDKIVYRTLGRTNFRIPVVSFGGMNSDSPDLNPCRRTEYHPRNRRCRSLRRGSHCIQLCPGAQG